MIEIMPRASGRKVTKLATCLCLVQLVVLTVTRYVRSDFDCYALNDLDDYEGRTFDYYNTTANPKPSTFLPFSSSTSDKSSVLINKCGLIPAVLVSNNDSNAKFFVQLLTNRPLSFRIDFRLSYVESFSHLNYYFSIRKYGGADVFSRVRTFARNDFDQREQIRASADALVLIEDISESLLASRALRLGDEKRNRGLGQLRQALNVSRISRHLVLDFEHFSSGLFNSMPSNLQLLQSMFTVCVVLANLRAGTSFTFPFMCVDISTDQQYYEYLRKINSQRDRNRFGSYGYGILIALAPVCFLFLMLIIFTFFIRRYLKSKASYDIYKYRHTVSPNRSSLKYLQRLCQKPRPSRQPRGAQTVALVDKASSNNHEFINGGLRRSFKYPLYYGTNSRLFNRNTPTLEVPSSQPKTGEMNTPLAVRRWAPNVDIASLSCKSLSQISGAVNSLKRSSSWSSSSMTVLHDCQSTFKNTIMTANSSKTRRDRELSKQLKLENSKDAIMAVSREPSPAAPSSHHKELSLTPEAPGCSRRRHKIRNSFDESYV